MAGRDQFDEARPARIGGRRRRARLAAVQALYQIELTGASAPSTIAEFRRHRLRDDVDGVAMDDIDPELFEELVAGVDQNQSELDRSIVGVLTPDWPLERIDTVLRSILRAGAFELAFRPDTPAKVVISEYVAIADSFFCGREPALVNGVLDGLARRSGAVEARPASA
ncbi:MAG TPA: transcription antitermination factor NusB [Alphaproteobacteria bacterium]|nr:transcription antitermination factor NusB [Alphaproteobacteria bacterium]